MPHPDETPQSQPATDPAAPTVPTRAPGWLNRTVLGIGAASFLADAGHEMATAALPALLATMGGGAGLLGIIEGVADGVASFAKLYSGLYSDRLARRKPLAVLGYVITAIGIGSFALATRAWHIGLGRIVAWFGRGARQPVRNVLMTEATVPGTRGRAFGFERAMDSAGAIVGPLLALVFLATLDVHTVFALTLVPGLLAAAAIAFLVREGPHEPRPHLGLWRGMAETPPVFRRFLVGVGLAGLGDFSNTLLILFATQAWTPEYGAGPAATMAVAFYAGYNVVYTASCALAGVFADRIAARSGSPRGLLAFGYALGVLPAALLLLPGTSFLKFGAVFALTGLYMGIYETVENTTAATYLPARIRGVGFGMLASVNGLGDLLSSAIVGILWGAASPTLAMLWVIACSLGGAAVIAATRPPATGTVAV
ncbi:MAG: MFS transporter [Myxococcota bacterium]